MMIACCVHMPADGHFFDSQVAYVGHADTCSALRGELVDPRKVQELDQVVVLSGTWGQGYFHFMIEVHVGVGVGVGVGKH